MKRFLAAALAVMLCAALCAFAFAETDPSEDSGELRYAKKALNLYKKMSTSSKKLCKVPLGGAMTLLSTDGAWANVVYTDAEGASYTGYVKKANIGKEPVATPTPTPTPNPDASPTPQPQPVNPVRPGGGGTRGGASATPTPSPYDLMGITPGKSASDGHTSGSYSSQPYGSVSLKTESDPAYALTLGGVTLDIELLGADGARLITASVEQDALILTPAEDAADCAWHVGGHALVTLKESGVASVILVFDEETAVSVSTGDLYSGVQYDALRLSGITPGEIDLTITQTDGEIALAVDANGQTFAPLLTENGAFYVRGAKVGALADLIPAPEETA